MPNKLLEPIYPPDYPGLGPAMTMPKVSPPLTEAPDLPPMYGMLGLLRHMLVGPKGVQGPLKIPSKMKSFGARPRPYDGNLGYTGDSLGVRG